MEKVLSQTFVPNVALVASFDCEDVYKNKLLNQKEPILAQSGYPIRVQGLLQLDSKPEPLDVEQLVRSACSHGIEDYAKVQPKLIEEVVTETTLGRRAQSYETWGHPLASILVVSSENGNPISALTQLYQQSYAELPQHISADCLRCVLYVEIESDQAKGGEDFETVHAQFGPYCYKIDGIEALETGLITIAQDSVYPYLDNVMRAWQESGNSKRSNSFGFGKLLKKLVNSGPPRPENNLFADVCRSMQPHVASIPARRPEVNLDMQFRRLADIAFMVKNYTLANSAYDSLRKTFSATQRWAELGAASEMTAVTAAIIMLSPSDVIHAVDSAMYTYNSRIHSYAHALRCALLTSLCLVDKGDQLLAAEILSMALMDINPILGSGVHPAQTAMLMEELSLAYARKGWNRKVRLWKKLAAAEWESVKA